MDKALSRFIKGEVRIFRSQLETDIQAKIPNGFKVSVEVNFTCSVEKTPSDVGVSVNVIFKNRCPVYEWSHGEVAVATNQPATAELIETILNVRQLQPWARKLIETWKENGNEPLSGAEIEELGIPNSWFMLLRSKLKTVGLPVIPASCGKVQLESLRGKVEDWKIEGSYQSEGWCKTYRLFRAAPPGLDA